MAMQINCCCCCYTYTLASLPKKTILQNFDTPGATSALRSELRSRWPLGFPCGQHLLCGLNSQAVGRWAFPVGWVWVQWDPDFLLPIPFNPSSPTFFVGFCL